MTQVRIEGVEDINRVLGMIAPREAKNLIRATVHDIAGQAAKMARANSPDDTGLLDKSTKHKRARGTPTTVQSDVTVAKAAFYWKFLEYGDGPDKVEHAMFLKALREVGADIERVYCEAFVRKLEARLARKRKGS